MTDNHEGTSNHDQTNDGTLTNTLYDAIDEAVIVLRQSGWNTTAARLLVAYDHSIRSQQAIQHGEYRKIFTSGVECAIDGMDAE